MDKLTRQQFKGCVE